MRSITERKMLLEESLSFKDQGIAKHSGKKVEKNSIDQTIRSRKYSPAFDVISSIIIVLTGLFILKVTGLYDGVSITAGKIGLGIVISYTCLVVFRRAIYSK